MRNAIISATVIPSCVNASSVLVLPRLASSTRISFALSTKFGSRPTRERAYKDSADSIARLLLQCYTVLEAVESADRGCTFSGKQQV